MAMVARLRGCSSTSVTLNPWRAASIAAEVPATPAPTTTTCSVLTRHLLPGADPRDQPLGERHRR